MTGRIGSYDGQAEAQGIPAKTNSAAVAGSAALQEAIRDIVLGEHPAFDKRRMIRDLVKTTMLDLKRGFMSQTADGRGTFQPSRRTPQKYRNFRPASHISRRGSARMKGMPAGCPIPVSAALYVPSAFGLCP